MRHETKTQMAVRLFNEFRRQRTATQITVDQANELARPYGVVIPVPKPVAGTDTSYPIVTLSYVCKYIAEHYKTLPQVDAL
jgi:hypothetical protein